MNYSRCLDLSKGELILVYGYGIEYLRPEVPSSIIATSNVLECLSKRLADLYSLAPRLRIYWHLNACLARINIRTSKRRLSQD